MTTALISKVELGYSTAADRGSIFTKDEQTRLNVFEKREQPIIGKPGESCNTNLFFGFFFDGTKNNYQDAETGKNHSNVARLYDCYPGLSVPKVLSAKMDWTYHPERYSNFFRVYIPGVASRFDLVGDTGEGWDATLGGGFGAFGKERIVWALVQAINNVHRYFLKAPLITPTETTHLVKWIQLHKDSRRLMGHQNPRNSRSTDETAAQETRRQFEKLLRRLHLAIAPHMLQANGVPAKIDPGIVKKIFVSTFGFSRGATQARAFQNWLMSLCSLDAQICGSSETMTLGGFPVQFDFLGLFDTVASVGFGNTMGNSQVLKIFDGHSGYADTEDSLRIPSGVSCVHLVAAHELRRSFPLDSVSVRGQLPDNCDEIVVPGVHSDLGSGYAPKEQGKGTDPAGADMLARIPLVYMYRAARLAGVPLKLEFASDVAKLRFKVSTKTIEVINSYLAVCKQKTGSLSEIMRDQARNQIEWRLARRAPGRTPLESTQFFKQATAFDQNDFHSANMEFEQEIADFEAWRKEKGEKFKPKHQDPGFKNDHDFEWEEISMWWDKSAKPPKAVTDLFDDYVHDSRAWFKLDPRSPDSEKKMHEKLREWVKQRKVAAGINERIVKENAALAARPSRAYGQRNPAPLPLPRRPVSDGLTPVQSKLAEEYAKMPPGQETIPRMITEGREPYGWGSKAGYLRFRKIYGGFDGVLLSALPEDTKDDQHLASG